jgi:hypothetical protein
MREGRDWMVSGRCGGVHADGGWTGRSRAAADNNLEAIQILDCCTRFGFM